MQHSRLEVDVVPTQAEDFPPSQAQHQTTHEDRPVRVVVHGSGERPDVIDVQGTEPPQRHRRSFDRLRDVAGYEVEPVRVRERVT